MTPPQHTPSQQRPPLPAHSKPEVGYGLFAHLISSDADLNIFRGFQRLHLRNILYLQSELTELEETLQDLDEHYNNGARGVDEWSVPRSWAAAKREGEYLDCVNRLRAASRDYYQALQIQQWLVNLKYPPPRARESLKQFVTSYKTHLLKIDASFILDERFVNDLVTVSWDKKEAMTHFLEKYLYKAFEDKRITTNQGVLLIFSNDRIRSFVRILAVLLSSILPILSILVLYSVRDEKIRLGLIVVFSALCSTVIVVLSNASNVEIMAATATYAAVQVVFVSGNLA